MYGVGAGVSPFGHLLGEAVHDGLARLSIPRAVPVLSDLLTVSRVFQSSVAAQNGNVTVPSGNEDPEPE